jgi:hypothetical protein
MESATGRFRLNFFPTENLTKHYVIIWCYNASSHNIVWVANREHPFPYSSAVLTFNQDGNLVISDDSDGGLLHW